LFSSSSNQKYAATIRKKVKASEDAVLEQGAEDVLSLFVAVKAKQAKYFLKDYKFAATRRNKVKASEDAMVEEGAEDVRGSIELQLFSVQLTWSRCPPSVSP